MLLIACLDSSKLYNHVLCLHHFELVLFASAAMYLRVKHQRQDQYEKCEQTAAVMFVTRKTVCT